MSRRTNRLTATLTAFVRQYGRRAQRGVDPNDRRYSREAEADMKRLHPELLSALLTGDPDDRMPLIRRKQVRADDLASRKRGRRP